MDSGYRRNKGYRSDFSRPKKDNGENRENKDENLVYGRNAVRELLESERDVEKLFVARGDREGSITLLISMARERGIPVTELDRVRLDELSSGGKHQGVVAYAAERNYSTVSQILDYARECGEAPFIVICDGIEDPHNLGAVIRSAECQGAHGVIIPKRRAVGLTTVVAKSSAGALEHMRVAKVTNIAQTIDELKEEGLWIYAADMDGTECRSADLRGPIALVLGSEGAGISRLVKEKCDFVVSIAMWGRVNSMNVSCAAAVILSEIARQRHTEVQSGR